MIDRMVGQGFVSRFRAERLTAMPRRTNDVVERMRFGLAGWRGDYR